MRNSLLQALSGEKRKLPPIHLWNPPFCGDIDMEIKRDGTWFYMGTPIGRAPLVNLFSSVLKREGESYFLVTPVEKVGIRVEDAPFLCVEMVEREGALHFRTLQNEWVGASIDNPLKFIKGEAGEYKPYILVRNNLWGLVNRALYYDVMAKGVEQMGIFGVESNGIFFEICELTDLT